ncbi:MAG: DNA-3-methyladenine glycosylase family protein [Saccharofermentanales bacterium]
MDFITKKGQIHDLMNIHGFQLEESKNPATGVPRILVRDVADLSPGGFDLKGTFESGQCFRWRSAGDGGYYGIAGGNAVKVSLSGGRHLLIENSMIEDFSAIWYRYFDLSTDYSPIVKAVCKDGFMQKATDYSSGSRMLCQEFEETLFSYILSSQNNIPRISKLIDDLCRTHGRPIEGPADDSSTGFRGFAFPDAATLAASFCRCDERTCRSCTSGNLCTAPFGGYRCPYIAKTARLLVSGSYQPDFTRLATQSAELSRKELCVFPGVGEKVADCVLLYSGIRKDICPVDTWVEKVIRSVYLDENAKIRDVRKFTKDYFGDYAGYAQLWFFHYARNSGMPY